MHSKINDKYAVINKILSTIKESIGFLKLFAIVFLPSFLSKSQSIIVCIYSRVIVISVDGIERRYTSFEYKPVMT